MDDQIVASYNVYATIVGGDIVTLNPVRGSLSMDACAVLAADAVLSRVTSAHSGLRFYANTVSSVAVGSAIYNQRFIGIDPHTSSSAKGGAGCVADGCAVTDHTTRARHDSRTDSCVVSVVTRATANNRTACSG